MSKILGLMRRRWKTCALAGVVTVFALPAARAVEGRPFDFDALTAGVTAFQEVAVPLAGPESGGGRPFTLIPDDIFRADYQAEPAVTVLAAGDIATCDNDGDERTAALLAAYPDAPILAVGDLAYSDGTAFEFANCYAPSWGVFKSRTYPVPGNHEYHTTNAGPYYAYFGALAGPAGNAASRGYYSFDLGGWHIVALNSEQDIAANGAQLKWLRADLAANQKACILAYFHRPRFVASQQYSDQFDVMPFWEALYAAGADVVLNGHDHSYQRYAPMDPSGQPDRAGIREFVVGTGGRPLYTLKADGRREAANGEGGANGVLKLSLRETGYDWEFLAAAGPAYRDSGSAPCH